MPHAHSLKKIAEPRRAQSNMSENSSAPKPRWLPTLLQLSRRSNAGAPRENPAPSTNYALAGLSGLAGHRPHSRRGLPQGVLSIETPSRNRHQRRQFNGRWHRKNRQNRNYRYTWMGQVVSEIGDHFNNIAVFALVMEKGGSGLVVSGVMLSRAILAVLAGPVAGVILDRLDRKRIMIASDLIRAVLALAFVLTIHQPRPWLLYLLSAGLMFASPFFTSGRAAILPTIANAEELHSANSLTQTTQWATLTAGTMLAGYSAAKLGYHWAFVLNSLSFVFSAGAIWRISMPGGFRAKRHAGATVVRPWHEYREGLVYMRSVPLMMGIALIPRAAATCG